MPEADTTAIGLKRARSSEPENQPVVSVTRRSHLDSLPLELLAEVLSYVASSRDVLVLSRTSKHFRAVLVDNPSTLFIWRRARARYVYGGIPDPLPGLSEASYAALLFDPGVCENCHKKTGVSYHSFFLRARICEAKTCFRLWQSTQLYAVTDQDETQYPEIVKWIPRIERNDDLYTGQTYVRRSTWWKAVDEYKKAQLLGLDAVAAYVESKRALVDALPARLQFCKELVKWATKRESARKTFNEAGTVILQQHSNQLGCTKWEILQSPTYSSIYHARLRCSESFLESEFHSIKKTVVAELAAQKQQKQHRETVHALQRKRSEVEAEYARLKAQQPAQVLPSLSEFRKLSVVKTYGASPSLKDPTLKNSFVASVLKDNLDQWRDAARAALAGVLGFPGWKAINKRKLHPVDRLTARFLCKRCDAAGKHTGKDTGMDFASACEHVCAHLSKNARSKQRWNAYNFVPDQRAIDAVTQVLKLCGTRAEETNSLRVADYIGDRILCRSCSLRVHVRNVVRHCKRHEGCTFALMPDLATVVARPSEFGQTKKLLENTPQAAAQRDRRVYGCRHCLLPSPPTGAVDDTSTCAEQEREREPACPPRHKLMSFNGLRSHLKEKHAVEWVADEDFFHQQDPVTATSSGS